MAQNENETRDARATDAKPAASASACCAPTEQATCCAPSAKSACCGTPDPETQPATRCGCR